MKNLFFIYSKRMKKYKRNNWRKENYIRKDIALQRWRKKDKRKMKEEIETSKRLTKDKIQKKRCWKDTIAQWKAKKYIEDLNVIQ